MISCWLSEACRSLLLHLLASRAVKSRLFSLMCSCPLHLDCLYACLVPRMMSMQNCKIWIGARLCCGVFTQCNFQLVHMSVTQLLQDSMLQVLRRCCGKRDQPKPSSFLPSRHAPIPPPLSPFPTRQTPDLHLLPLARAKEHVLKDATCLKTSGIHYLCAFLSRVGLTDSSVFPVNSLSIRCSTVVGRRVAEKGAAATLLHEITIENRVATCKFDVDCLDCSTW